MKRIVYLFLLVFLAGASPVWAAAYTTTTCLYGETGTCRLVSDCSQANIQTTVDDSTGGTGYASPTSFNGDGVYVPGGSCAWTSGVSWQNKNINIIGGVGGTTNITLSSPTAFTIRANPGYGAWRISNFSFSGTPSQTVGVTNLGETYSGYFRIDHLTLNYTTNANIFNFTGPVFGLIDHITSTTAGSGNFLEQSGALDSECRHGYTDTDIIQGEYSQRTLALGLGTADAIYVEDSTIAYTGGNYLAIIDGESGGQRTVFRHNTTTGGLFYNHWSRGHPGWWCPIGEIDGYKIEIYNNNINGALGESTLGYAGRFESGTGVVYNNTIKNFDSNTILIDEGRGCGGSDLQYIYDCEGSHAWDGNGGDTNAPGWPCAGQVGTACVAGNCARGAIDNVPLILWNNGTQDTCATGGACTNSTTISVNPQAGDAGDTCTRTMANYLKSTAHTASVPKYNGAVDFSDGNATMPATVGTYTNNYAAYTYPHPLQGGGEAPAASPNMQGTTITGGGKVQ